jgi:hypothetical protein
LHPSSMTRGGSSSSGRCGKLEAGWIERPISETRGRPHRPRRRAHRVARTPASR